jgi:RNA polymerase sigma factor (sigma-70 family)
MGKELLDDEFSVTCLLQECYLKVWAHRAKIESLPHAYRFMRMNLRWQVLKHIQKTSYQLYRQMVSIDYHSGTVGELADMAESFENELEPQRLDELTKAMNCLTERRQLIARLHFIQGLTSKQIAQRVGSSTMHINSEIQHSTLQIKKMVQTRPKSNYASKPLVSDSHLTIKLLSVEQAKIYQLRKEHKKSFAEISKILGHPQQQVQQHYIQAHQLVKAYNGK